MSGQRAADQLAGAGVPQPDRLVITGGGDSLSIRAEGHCTDLPGVAPQWFADLLTGDNIPQGYGVVNAARHQELPIRAKGEACHGIGIAAQIPLAVQTVWL